MTRAYLGLGSNLGDRRAYLSAACRLLAKEETITIVKKSSLYRSAPWGKPDQPFFYNAVLEIETSLTANELLALCQRIEDGLGRKRLEQWGPRTIDIDILLCGEETVASEALFLPHPYLAAREFVLRPLYEIAPQLVIPGKGPLKELLLAYPDNKLELVAQEW